jgi:bisphosphoglycerate-independent phosphoglycerate mutase (AlkP superfamily)
VRGCAKSGVKRVRVHILLDGRDVPDGSSIADTTELQKARRRAAAATRHALPLSAARRSGGPGARCDAP